MTLPLSPCPRRGHSAAGVGPFKRAHFPISAEFQGAVVADGIGSGNSNGEGREWGRPSLCRGCELGAAGARGREDTGLQDLGASKHKEKSFRIGKPVCERLSCPAASGWCLRAAASIPVVKLEFSLSNRVITLRPFLLPPLSVPRLCLVCSSQEGGGYGEG